MKKSVFLRLAATLICLSLILFAFAGCAETSAPAKESDTPAETVAPALTETAEEAPATDSFWAALPDEFVFASGVGGWATYVTIADDGSFTGNFHDSEMGSTGEDYPNGTVYVCDFSGAFTEPQKLTDTIYTTTLKSISQEKEEDEEWIEDGIKYIYSYPYGFDKAEHFYIYLPGTPADQIEEEFFPWAQLDPTYFTELPDDMYGLYNINSGLGFINSIL